MDLPVRLLDLPSLHPRLLWENLAGAAAAILGRPKRKAAISLELEVEHVPGFGTGSLRLEVDTAGFSTAFLQRLRRTFEASRLVELAAIAVAGLAVYHVGGHEIRDVSLRGMGTDYLIGEQNLPLEIAGRSKRAGFENTWKMKREELLHSYQDGFYLCVVEFQTPAGRLAFWEP